jgi:hypothetical protein
MATTKPTTNPDPVAEANAAIAKLEGQREKLVKRRAEHEAERQRIAFAARAQGDREASARLGEMTGEAIRSDHELRDIDAALVTARERLADAEHAAATAADRQRAEEARTIVDELAKVFVYTDQHLMAALKGLLAIERGVAELRQKGVALPTDVQLRLGIVAVLGAWLQQLPRLWWNEISAGLRFRAPNERKTALSYWGQLESSLRNEPQKKEVA